jgi:CheY-like chemotaxis protein
MIDAKRMSENHIPDGKKILVVDDNPVILRHLSMILRANGFETTTAQDGADVVCCLRKQRPDLILLDIFFPWQAEQSSSMWDGFEILQWLRRMGGAADIPFIVISAADPDKYKSRSLAEGARAFFSKPVPIPELIETIYSVFKSTTEKSSEAAPDAIPELHMATG